MSAVSKPHYAPISQVDYQICQRNIQPCVALLGNIRYVRCKWENERGKKEYQREDEVSSVWQPQLSSGGWEMAASAPENPSIPSPPRHSKPPSKTDAHTSQGIGVKERVRMKKHRAL